MFDISRIQQNVGHHHHHHHLTIIREAEKSRGGGADVLEARVRIFIVVDVQPKERCYDYCERYH